MEITFEPATTADIASIYTFSLDLIDRYEDTAQIDYRKVCDWVHEKIEKHIGAYMRILVGGELAGYYYFHPADGKMELDDLYILPQYRNQGIGTQVIHKCRQETNLPVFLYVFSRNKKAIALYSRLGFRIRASAGNTRYIMEG